MFQLQCQVPGVEVDSSHKEGLEGIAGGFKNRIWVPECNLLLQFIRNLANIIVVSLAELKYAHLG